MLRPMNFDQRTPSTITKMPDYFRNNTKDNTSINIGILYIYI